jgi:hypothetical protein
LCWCSAGQHPCSWYPMAMRVVGSNVHPGGGLATSAATATSTHSRRHYRRSTGMN